MNPKYMLDTNICIYLMKHQPAHVRGKQPGKSSCRAEDSV